MPEDTTELYTSVRPLLFSIAYRMLGTVSEAEDVVQESFLRLHRAVADGTQVQTPKAYLTTTATRLSLDVLRSARRRRESYIGEWLPEPLLQDRTPGPAEHAELSDSLSMAFLVVLESLNPVERAVFLLREVFGYEFEAVAEFVERTPDNCRQILVRARGKVQEKRPRYETSVAQRTALADTFFAACRRGDLGGLKQLLAADVVWHGDGGGKAPAVARSVVGVDKVLRLLVSLLGQGQALGMRIDRVLVNGQPGTISRTAEGQVVSVFELEIADGQVQAIRSVVNPDKLGHLGDVADVRGLMHSLRRRGD
ncbi:MAG: RNA polymerase sigma-70 factor [Jatrophihabitantaceae bacterium]